MNSAAWLRWLHIYVSMASFAIVFFFAVTGITLNHAAWFDSGNRTSSQTKASLNPSWVRTQQPETIARLEVVEHLRKTHHLSGDLADFRTEDTQCTVSFKGPGYTADAFIDRETGTYELSETRQGLIAVLNDLHKGRDTGRAWSWVIDLSAAFMALVSLTGTVLLLYLPRRRAAGLWTAAIGAVLCLAVYWLFVP